MSYTVDESHYLGTTFFQLQCLWNICNKSQRCDALKAWSFSWSFDFSLASNQIKDFELVRAATEFTNWIKGSENINHLLTIVDSCKHGLSYGSKSEKKQTKMESNFSHCMDRSLYWLDPIQSIETSSLLFIGTSRLVWYPTSFMMWISSQNSSRWIQFVKISNPWWAQLIWPAIWEIVSVTLYNQNAYAFGRYSWSLKSSFRKLCRCQTDIVNAEEFGRTINFIGRSIKRTKQNSLRSKTM